MYKLLDDCDLCSLKSILRDGAIDHYFGVRHKFSIRPKSTAECDVVNNIGGGGAAGVMLEKLEMKVLQAVLRYSRPPPPYLI